MEDDAAKLEEDPAAQADEATAAAAATTKDSSSLSNPTFKRLYFPPLLRAPELVSSQTNSKKELYWDRSHYDSHEAQIAALKKSSTLYVGNLSFTTKSRHVTAHFSSLIGPVKRVYMGLDRIKKTPCGFCFVELEHRHHALQAVALLSGTKLDGSIIRVELDAGFQPGRQYGRGAKGGQVRHDRKGSITDRKRARSSEGDTRPPPPPPRPPPPPPPRLPPAANDAMASYEPSAPSLPIDDSADDYYAPPAEGSATAGDDAGTEDDPAAKRQRTE